MLAGTILTDAVKDIIQKLPNLSSDELRTIQNSVTHYRELKSRQTMNTLARGDKVSWPSKNGMVMTGDVVGVMQKNVRVKARNGQMWRVSGSLLTKA